MDTYLKHHQRVRARIRRYLRETLSNQGVFLQITTAKDGNYEMLLKGKIFGRLADAGDPANVSAITADVLTMPVLVEVVLTTEQRVDLELSKHDHFGKQGRGGDYMVFGFNSMMEAAKFRILHSEFQFVAMKPD